MKTRILTALRKLLLIWGAVTLPAAIGLGGFIAYEVTFGNTNQIDTASKHDVRFVLNWCELGEDRIEKVIHSYVSGRSVTGDHLDAYAIKITRVDVTELTSGKDRPSGPSQWYRGDQLPPLVNVAVDEVGSWLHTIPWFPEVTELRSANVWVYPWSIYTHGITPSAVKLIFVRPSDNMIFYFSDKT